METVSEQKRRWLILASACLEMFLFSGIFFGWSSLMFILKQEGIFSHLCAKDVNNSTNSPSDAGTDDMGLNQANVLSPVAPSNQTTQNWSFSGETSGYRTSSGLSNCLAQDNMLSLCFTVSTALLYTSTSLAGALTYKLGTRIARLAGWFCFTAGGLLTAFTSKENPWLLFPGLPTLAFGGVVLLITNIQIGMLFGKGQSTVISSMTGLFDSSSVIMLFIKFAHEKGFSRRNSILILCGLHVLTLLNTLLLMPRAHFTWNNADLEKSMEVSAPRNELDVKTDDIVNTSRNANNTMDKAEKRPIPTLKECLLSTMYILEVAWIAILQLRFSYFLVSLNSWLTHRKTDVSYFTNVSLYSLMCGLPISLTSGATFDYFKHFFANQPTSERRRLYPSVVMLSLTSGIGVLMSVTVLISTTESIYAAFVFSALLRSFVYSVDANVVNLVFPPEYFGALFGISDFIGGSVSTLQYALVVWHMSAGGFTKVNYTVLAMSAVTFVHPAVQMCRVLRKGHGDTPLGSSRSDTSTHREIVVL